MEEGGGTVYSVVLDDLRGHRRWEAVFGGVRALVYSVLVFVSSWIYFNAPETLKDVLLGIIFLQILLYIFMEMLYMKLAMEKMTHAVVHALEGVYTKTHGGVSDGAYAGSGQ